MIPSGILISSTAAKARVEAPEMTRQISELSSEISIAAR